MHYALQSTDAKLHSLKDCGELEGVSCNTCLLVCQAGCNVNGECLWPVLATHVRVLVAAVELGYVERHTVRGNLGCHGCKVAGTDGTSTQHLPKDIDNLWEGRQLQAVAQMCLGTYNWGSGINM